MKNELELKIVLSDFRSNASNDELLNLKSNTPIIDLYIPKLWKGIKLEGLDRSEEPDITSN